MSTELWDRSAQTAADGRSDAAGPRGWRRRWVLVAVLAAAVVAVAFLFVSQGPGPASSAPLDPRNPTANGAQALARVLQSQGVRVDIARGQAELERAGPDADTTVFVARTAPLAESTTKDLAQLVSRAERLVLVAPDRSVLRYLAPEVGITDARRAAQDLVATDCRTSDVRAGETLSRSQVEYRSPLADAGCFTHDGSSVYLALARRGVTPPMVLLGSTSAPANDQITEASNAAVLLRTLGHSSRVVWYVPSTEDVPAADDADGLGSLLPPWAGPVLALGGVAFLGGHPVARPPVRTPRPPNRCPSSCAPSRPPRAAAASTAGRATLRAGRRHPPAGDPGPPRRLPRPPPPQPLDHVPGRRRLRAGTGHRGLRRDRTLGRRGGLAAPRSTPHPGRPSPRARRRARRPREGSTPLMSDTPDHPSAPAGPPPPAPAERPAYPRDGQPQPVLARTPAVEASDRAREALVALRREVGKAVVGQDAAVTGLVIALLVPRPRAARGRARRRQDAARARARRRAGRSTPSACSSPPT